MMLWLLLLLLLLFLAVTYFVGDQAFPTSSAQGLPQLGATHPWSKGGYLRRCCCCRCRCFCGCLGMHGGYEGKKRVYDQRFQNEQGALPFAEFRLLLLLLLLVVVVVLLVLMLMLM